MIRRMVGGLAFVFASALIVPSAQSEEFTYQELRLRGVKEFMRLAAERWDADDMRKSVGFALKARGILRERGGPRSPLVEQVERMISTALEEIETARSTPENQLLFTAMEELEKRAGEGDVAAAFELGYRYAYGIGGLSPDFSHAFEFLQLGASEGHADSLFELGLILRRQRIEETLMAIWIGNDSSELRGIPLGGIDPLEFRLFNDAHERGHLDAKAFVGLSLIDQGVGGSGSTGRESIDRGRKLLQESARSGSVWGQYLMGMVLAQGFGVPANPAAARNWARKAADQGLREAQTLLGELLTRSGARGQVTEEAKQEGLLYLYCATEQGDWLAYYPLGLMLATGKGIEVDRTAGVHWLEEAAEAGHMKAAEAVRALR